MPVDARSSVGDHVSDDRGWRGFGLVVWVLVHQKHGLSHDGTVSSAVLCVHTQLSNLAYPNLSSRPKEQSNELFHWLLATMTSSATHHRIRSQIKKPAASQFRGDHSISHFPFCAASAGQSRSAGTAWCLYMTHDQGQCRWKDQQSYRTQQVVGFRRTSIPVL